MTEYVDSHECYYLSSCLKTNPSTSDPSNGQRLPAPSRADLLRHHRAFEDSDDLRDGLEEKMTPLARSSLVRAACGSVDDPSARQECHLLRDDHGLECGPRPTRQTGTTVKMNTQDLQFLRSRREQN